MLPPWIASELGKFNRKTLDGHKSFVPNEEQNQRIESNTSTKINKESIKQYLFDRYHNTNLFDKLKDQSQKILPRMQSGDAEEEFSNNDFRMHANITNCGHYPDDISIRTGLHPNDSFQPVYQRSIPQPMPPTFVPNFDSHFINERFKNESSRAFPQQEVNYKPERAHNNSSPHMELENLNNHMNYTTQQSYNRCITHPARDFCRSCLDDISSTYQPLTLPVNAVDVCGLNAYQSGQPLCDLHEKNAFPPSFVPTFDDSDNIETERFTKYQNDTLPKAPLIDEGERSIESLNT